ncbi:hypothetical protein BCR34DRAFT_654952 [Clohesyomyces aquaticus]|uniref:Uncharacterized protein n=1 Tax=Clohesyomyces aquaticus TaxID=1231657 RepID=A0A1Y1ZJG4_9PLEO|nr:hypothetical protein BCR34DRAFT_654952 [Clohesyomyces aquaticus]
MCSCWQPCLRLQTSRGSSMCNDASRRVPEATETSEAGAWEQRNDDAAADETGRGLQQKENEEPTARPKGVGNSPAFPNRLQRHTMQTAPPRTHENRLLRCAPWHMPCWMQLQSQQCRCRNGRRSLQGGSGGAASGALIGGRREARQTRPQLSHRKKMTLGFRACGRVVSFDDSSSSMGRLCERQLAQQAVSGQQRANADPERVLRAHEKQRQAETGSTTRGRLRARLSCCVRDARGAPRRRKAWREGERASAVLPGPDDMCALMKTKMGSISRVAGRGVTCCGVVDQSDRSRVAARLLARSPARTAPCPFGGNIGPAACDPVSSTRVVAREAKLQPHGRVAPRRGHAMRVRALPPDTSSASSASSRSWAANGERTAATGTPGQGRSASSKPDARRSRRAAGPAARVVLASGSIIPAHCHSRTFPPSSLAPHRESGLLHTIPSNKDSSATAGRSRLQSSSRAPAASCIVFPSLVRPLPGQSSLTSSRQIARPQCYTCYPPPASRPDPPRHRARQSGESPRAGNPQRARCSPSKSAAPASAAQRKSKTASSSVGTTFVSSGKAASHQVDHSARSAHLGFWEQSET